MDKNKELVKTAISEYLTNHGYGGLVDMDGECMCMMNHLMGCEEDINECNCEPAYKTSCKPEDCCDCKQKEDCDWVGEGTEGLSMNKPEVTP
ncbi:MAG: hypothetical protein PHE17_19400 [Thiothrix sp.]|uniref:hypothetical protein n=1 Tax=Thiothrix sp. TaxID=1032 RepID=UPI00262E47BD|nr:hypothetical protein [Thiothrix sp.]MDD5395194.1 hypothetical protein [Thiothrix sp.]